MTALASGVDPSERPIGSRCCVDELLVPPNPTGETPTYTLTRFL